MYQAMDRCWRVQRYGIRIEELGLPSAKEHLETAGRPKVAGMTDHLLYWWRRHLTIMKNTESEAAG
jgi:hypothetical protein